ncbi:hypothetical protein RvY_04218 [Ramazzottius varieornatus]|uniref:Uncharacterized protein n=1 Tax=Ramazzottius varieornatus TaxID=947166 RepID=A0A1D1V0Y2_RAMVA|nr:hypothetical protein RvY_04218 [Ramazzottius varieornatus]
MRVTPLRWMASEAVAMSKGSKGGAVSPRAKPVLRGWLAADTRIHAIYGFALAIGGCLWYRVYVCDARKAKYAEFWRTYDAHADFKRMVKAGDIYPDISIEDVEAYERDILAKRAAAQKK